MTFQTRRAALMTFITAGAAVPVLLSAQALAQTAPAEGGDQAEYVMQTMMVGGLAMRTSEIAMEKATDPMVKEFAALEVGEQRAIASVLATTEAGKSPPAVSEQDAAMEQQLNEMEAGPDFDQMYIQGQIDGHNRLLEIQRTLSGETVATVEAITARLAEQAVTSHLAMLNHIQNQLDGNSNAGAPASGKDTPAAGTEAPASGGEAPATDTGAPATGTEVPATEAPATGSEAPAAGTEAAPATNG